MRRRKFLNYFATAIVASAFSGVRRAVAQAAERVWPSRPREAFSADTLAQTIKALFGEREILDSEKITITAAELAENGAVVPVKINTEFPHAKQITILASKNPTMKVPMLEDGDHVVFDSRVIFRYLSTKLSWAPLNWTQENRLTLIDAVNDSFVQLLLLRRSELDIASDSLYMRLHKERVEKVMDTLEQQVVQGCYQGWEYPAMCLYSLLDWVVFRELYPLDDHPGLLDFMQQHHHRICVTATDPRG